MSRAPRHLALIPDGNRRWARQRGLGPTDGHRAGIQQIGAVVAAAWGAGVEVVTFWWGSPANLTLRAPAEVEGIVGVLHDWLSTQAPRLLSTANARFDAYGRWPALCPTLQAPIQALSGRTGDRRLVLLMAYDGREELEAAARRFCAAGCVGSLGDHLWTASLPPVDLLIRTGGQPHLSAGFLAWGLADAQLRFSDALWPDFDPPALAEALASFARTERRFGR